MYEALLAKGLKRLQGLEATARYGDGSGRIKRKTKKYVF